MGAVKRTAEFLGQRKLLDYSLIVKVELGGVSNSINFIPSRGLEVRSLKATCKLRGVDGTQRCTFHFMCVLDYLNPWVTRKKMESWFKRNTTFGQAKKKECSALKPKRYALRFLAGMQYFFPGVGALNGSIQAYHGKNKNYRATIEKVVLKTGEMGPTWLNVMGNRSSGAYVAPVHHVSPHYNFQDSDDEEQGGVTPMMWAVLIILGVFMLCSICLFLIVVSRSRGKGRSRRAPRGVRKKSAKFPKRKTRRRRISIDSDSDSY